MEQGFKVKKKVQWQVNCMFFAFNYLPSKDSDKKFIT